MEEKLKSVDTKKSNAKDRHSQYKFSLFDPVTTEKYIAKNNISIWNDDISGQDVINVEEENTFKDENFIQSFTSDGKSCKLCAIIFETHEDQKLHFKLDWHKFNIKQMLLNKSVVDERTFEEITSGDVSSISGSDSEVDEQSVDNPLETLSLLQSGDGEDASVVNRAQAKVHFTNNFGQCMSIYREVLFSSKENIRNSEELVLKIENAAKEGVWVILMTGGGHFAGAVFSGNEVTVSKTFHRYTVRAKRGTAQGIRDSKQGGNQPKSAGASLRRYNEAALAQDIQNLLESWSNHIEQCNKIFLRVPHAYKWIFFEGKKPALQKDDFRLRSIPFATRRATFKELKNVHERLSTVLIHDKMETCLFKKEAPSQEIKDPTTNVNRCNEIDVEQQETDAQIHDSVGYLKHTAKKKKSKETPKKTRTDVKKDTAMKEEISQTWAEIREAITLDDIDKVNCILNKTDDTYGESMPNASPTKVSGAEGNCCSCRKLCDMKFQTYAGETLLHYSSRMGHGEILKRLLEAGADPTLRDDSGRVPFAVAKDKETRNVFRRYMACHPDEHDYRQAQIPSALTQEMEEKATKKSNEKKRVQAKAKKERLKLKKEENRQKEEEARKVEEAQRERNWFQNLSDREKRAVAADRRLGNICFNCSENLQGIISFERLGNKYCSTECVQKHRKLLETTVK